MTVLSPQEAGAGFDTDLNKVRPVSNFSVYQIIHLKLGYLTLNTDLYAKAHTEITVNNHCYTEATLSSLVQLKIKQTRQNELDIQPLFSENDSTTTSQYKYTADLVNGHFQGKEPSHVLRQPLDSVMHVPSSNTNQKEEKQDQQFSSQCFSL